MKANFQFQDRWQEIALPGSEHTENALNRALESAGPGRTLLNCAIPATRAQTFTDLQLPSGVAIGDCIASSVAGRFPEALREWRYRTRMQALPQLPFMTQLPPQHARLDRGPWFASPSQALWLGINARHLRYHHRLWRELKPITLQGVHTTLILVTPQIGFALTPRIQLEKNLLFLGSLAHGLSPAQLFLARNLYPDAALGSLADAPAPIFANGLPATGGFAYPTVDGEPDPWRVLAHFGQSDRYYGYPFHKTDDAFQDFSLCAASVPGAIPVHVAGRHPQWRTSPN